MWYDCQRNALALSSRYELKSRVEETEADWIERDYQGPVWSLPWWWRHKLDYTTLHIRRKSLPWALKILNCFICYYCRYRAMEPFVTKLNWNNHKLISREIFFTKGWKENFTVEWKCSLHPYKFPFREKTHIEVGSQTLHPRNPRSKTSISHFPASISFVMFSTTRSWDSQFPLLSSFCHEEQKLNFMHVAVYAA